MSADIVRRVGLVLAVMALLGMALSLAGIERNTRPVPLNRPECSGGTGDGTFCYIDQPDGTEWVFVTQPDGTVTFYSQSWSQDGPND